MAVAELGYKIDSSGAVVAAANLDDMTAAAVRAEAGADRMAVGQRKLSAATARSGVNMRMLAPQLSQIGQMYTATGQLGQAVAVQAADIGLAFGVAGTIIGAVAGVALPSLISALSDTGNEASDLEGRLDILSEIMDKADSATEILEKSVSELAEEYGDAYDRVREFAAFQAELAQSQSARRLSDQFVVLSDAIGRYSVSSSEVTGPAATWASEANRNAVRAITSDFNVTTEQALALKTELDAIANANTFEKQRAAMGSLISALESLGVPVSKLPVDLQIAVAEMITLSNETDNVDRAVKRALGQTVSWASAMASVGNEISAIMSSMSSLTGGVIGNAAKQTEIDALRAGKSIRDAARAATDFKAQTEFDAREQGANMFERLIISGERYQHERGMQLDAELDREREAARERDRITGGGGGGAAGLTSEQYESKLEALRTSLLNEREVLEQWKLEQDTLLADQRAIELLGIEEHNQAKLRLEEEYNQRRVEIAAMGEESKLSLALGGASDVLGVIGQFNDKAFKLAKVAAAAQALISTLQGSAEALKLPYPYNLIAAAQVAAKGFGLVAAIKGVSSSGGSASISAGGTSSAAGVTATSSAADVVPQTNAIIQVDSGRSRLTIEEINDIITGIQSQSEDGVIISGIQTA